MIVGKSFCYQIEPLPSLLIQPSQSLTLSNINIGIGPALEKKLKRASPCVGDDTKNTADTAQGHGTGCGIYQKRCMIDLKCVEFTWLERRNAARLSGAAHAEYRTEGLNRAS
jgi:hypothetical protein